MKFFKFSIAIIVLVLFFSKSFALTSNNQPINDQSGVYLNASDFNHNKLYLSVDNSTKNTFHLNDFLGGKIITVIHDGKKYQFSKDSIFGFKDKDGITYRYFNDHSGKYKIVENKKVIIYERRLPNGKAGFKAVRYFSKGADSDIFLLSKYNLKRAFNNDADFDVIDTDFQNDSDLLYYDATHHEYRINYYLSKPDRS